MPALDCRTEYRTYLLGFPFFPNPSGIYPTSELILEWGRKGKARRAKSGDGVLGDGAASPSPPARGCRSAVSLPSGVRGGRVFLYSEPSVSISPHINSWGVRSPAYPASDACEYTYRMYKILIILQFEN